MKPTRLPQEVEVEVEGRAQEPSHPQNTHQNFVLDRLLVKWMNPIINLAYHTPLEESDVWDVADTDMSVKHHASLFAAAWAAE